MEAIFQPLFSLVGGVSDKSKALFMFGIWGFILCGLFYLVWNDPTMWPAKPDPKEKAKHAKPKPRPAKPLRSIPIGELWKLGVYEHMIIVFSFMVLALGGVQLTTALGREYAVDEEQYRQHVKAWQESRGTLEKMGRPDGFGWDLMAALAVLAIGLAIFWLGFNPLRKAYRTLRYGKKVVGKSKGTVPDWTRSLIIVPAFAITFTWRPDGSQVDEESIYRGMPGERWYETDYPNGKEITVIYDEADPSVGFAPDLFQGLTLIDLEGESRKKRN